MFLPKATSNLLLTLFCGISCNISLNDTGDTESFGISIPTVLFPGIGASILTSFLARAREISLLIPKSLLNLVPVEPLIHTV